MFKKIISTVAPLLGGALGGPGGALAGKLLSSVLTPGNDNPTNEQLEKAYNNATPEQLVKLKELDTKFAQIEADDRANAREREIKTKDKMPAYIASAIIIGFFGILFLLVYEHIATTNSQVIDLLIGSLATVFVQVVSYYFGAGRRKNN